MSWETARGYAWARAMRVLGERPGVALLAVLIAALALTVPLSALVIAQALPSQMQPAAEISAFVAPGLSQAESKALSAKLSALDGVAAVKLVTRAEAWSELQRRSKDLQGLPEARFNTLPDVFVVQFAPGTAAATVDAAVNAATKLPRVESVQADLGWYRRLSTAWRFMFSATLGGLAMGALLVAVVVIGAVAAVVSPDASELRVLDQIGAARDFARRPYVYAGAVVLGLASAVSLGLVIGGQFLARGAVRELSQALGLEQNEAGLPWPLGVAFVAAAVLTGAIAAYYFSGRAVGRAETWNR